MQTINQKGLSLLELLLVIAIIGVMAVAIGPNYAASKKAKSMSFARTQMVNDIRYVQNFTLSSTKAFADGTSAPGGFGIRFQKNSSSYIIFGDKMQGGATPNHRYDPGATGADAELLETVNLVGGIKISDLKISKNGSAFADVTGGYVDYNSAPPYGKIFIDNTQDNVILQITFTNGISSEVFNLRSSGFIS